LLLYWKPFSRKEGVQEASPCLRGVGDRDREVAEVRIQKRILNGGNAMQIKQSGGSENMTRAMSLELLKFAVERLPRYEWLRKAYPPEETPTTGEGTRGERD
jgi:hypothetical protein